ncbi:hypothetical protein PMAYCL1PPCAC_04648 [Pristionchus mayeri]|uniref:F-box domain-containing protein n=1 Tax=Pristionchus mayeri TaxID=1317129 RepID=A0AAN4Z9J7_9BILA|nr:hypothetical protein PMAYCL1PPCAC_04648 [Pristionchus mayeri]
MSSERPAINGKTLLDLPNELLPFLICELNNADRRSFGYVCKSFNELEKNSGFRRFEVVTLNPNNRIFVSEAQEPKKRGVNMSSTNLRKLLQSRSD